jgi:hypothetical protein
MANFKDKFYNLIYQVFSYFQFLAGRGRLEYALQHVMENAVAAMKISETTVRRAKDWVLNRPGDQAVASVVASVHGKDEKRREV